MLPFGPGEQDAAHHAGAVLDEPRQGGGQWRRRAVADADALQHGFGGQGARQAARKRLIQ